MDKSATPLPSAEALAAFKQHRAQIVQTVVSRLLAEPGAFDHLGDRAEEIVTAGMEFLTLTLETSMQIDEPALLDDQMAWAKDHLPHEGVSPQQLLTGLRIYAQVVAEILPPPCALAVNRFINGMIGPQREG